MQLDVALSVSRISLNFTYPRMRPSSFLGFFKVRIHTTVLVHRRTKGQFRGRSFSSSIYYAAAINSFKKLESDIVLLNISDTSKKIKLEWK